MKILDPEHSLAPKETMRRALSMKEVINSAKTSESGPERAEAMDRDDAEQFFRCLLQMARYLAKKYGFTIKQWPEK